MSEIRVITKYANRKLYCSQSSRYVTLSELASSIKSGAQISVLEKETKKDVTNEILKGMVATLNVDNQVLIDLIKR